MILNIYSVKDVKVGVFKTPFFQNSNVEAIRSFQQAVQDENSVLNKYPADFELWHIGGFDDDTATFTVLDAKCLGNALTFKRENDLQGLGQQTSIPGTQNGEK